MLGEPPGLLTLVVGLAGGGDGDVVGDAALFGVVVIVDTGGGGPTVVDDCKALLSELGPLPPSLKTMLGAYGSLTTMAA